MTGELVPFVLVPRYTGLVGAQDFTSVPLDVTAFKSASVVLWRGPLIGTTPTFQVRWEVSQDTIKWSNATGISNPSSNTPLAVGIPFSGRRWFRVRITTTGTGVGATCWCAGLLEYRVS